MISTHPKLEDKKYWIFDMDGTLTVAKHDFSAIRESLNIPANAPILEHIKTLPRHQAQIIRRQLYEISIELAHEAEPAPGIIEVVNLLKQSGCRLSLVTRNSFDSMDITLKRIGLSQHFPIGSRISRDCAPPKPLPDGILMQLKRWNIKPDQAVMVGDYDFDLRAGRAAGVTTLYFNPTRDLNFAQYADAIIHDWHDWPALIFPQDEKS